MRESVYNSTLMRSTLVPDTYAATTNGATVDLAEPELSNFRSAMLIVHAGTVTDGTHAVTLQESANGTDWTAVAAEHLQGAAISLTTGGGDSLHELGYTGHARYLRAVATVSGSPVTGGVYAAAIALSGARRTPIPRS